MFQDSKNGVIISLCVQPNAPRSCIVGRFNDSLKIKIKAPPVDGKANAEIVDFFSKLLSVPKIRFELLKGGKSKLKKILIYEMTAAQLVRKLQL